MPTNTQFRTIRNVNQSTVSDGLQSNVVEFFNWGFLNIGAFFNVTIPTSGAYGGNAHRLRVSEAKGYIKGQVWEGFRKQWIWESGVEGTAQPISISGVNVNSTFYPLSTSGAFSYKIDYPHGRVIFNSAINPSSVVTCEHSYRYIQFYNADAPWWKKLQENSFRLDSSHFNLYGSGSWAIPNEHRVQMPAVVVQGMPGGATALKELGNLSRWHDPELRFYILTETDAEWKFIHDVIVDQTEKTLIGFDKNKMITGTGFPLNYDGTLSSNPKTYPYLIKPEAEGGFEWRKIKFDDSLRSWLQQEPNNGSPFYNCVVSMKFMIDLP